MAVSHRHSHNKVIACLVTFPHCNFKDRGSGRAGRLDGAVHGHQCHRGPEGEGSQGQEHGRDAEGPRVIRQPPPVAAAAVAVLGETPRRPLQGQERRAAQRLARLRRGGKAGVA